MERDPSIIFSRAFLRREPGGGSGGSAQSSPNCGAQPHTSVLT